MSWLVPIVIQIISGAGGGNIVGTIMKNIPLSKILQTVLGGVGGGLGGLLLSVLGGEGGETGAEIAQAVGGILESMGGIEGLLKNVGGAERAAASWSLLLA